MESWSTGATHKRDKSSVMFQTQTLPPLMLSPLPNPPCWVCLSEINCLLQRATDTKDINRNMGMYVLTWCFNTVQMLDTDTDTNEFLSRGKVWNSSLEKVWFIEILCIIWWMWSQALRVMNKMGCECRSAVQLVYFHLWSWWCRSRKSQTSHSGSIRGIKEVGFSSLAQQLHWVWRVW